MSNILRAFEGFNTLPRDVRVYLLEPLLGRFNLASCYFAVFGMVYKPARMYVRQAAAHGWIQDEWIQTNPFDIACGSAEGGHEELFDRISKPHVYTNVIAEVNCHPVIWNKLVRKIHNYERVVELLRLRVMNGWGLTGLDIDYDIAGIRINYYKCLITHPTLTQELIGFSSDRIVKSIIIWLLSQPMGCGHIVNAIARIDRPDLMQMLVDELECCPDVVRDSIDENTPRLIAWFAQLNTDM